MSTMGTLVEKTAAVLGATRQRLETPGKRIVRRFGSQTKRTITKTASHHTCQELSGGSVAGGGPVKSPHQVVKGRSQEARLRTSGQERQLI